MNRPNRRRIRNVSAALLGTGAAGAVAVGLATALAQGRATGDVDELLSQPSRPDRPVAVFAGASIVRGRASFDAVELLRRIRPEWAWVNAGVNGNVAHEVRERIPSILACQPQVVTVLVGTNDVQATLSRSNVAGMLRSEQLHPMPTLDRYRETMAGLVHDLRTQGVRVLVCSLPPLGQDLYGPANLQVRRFNEAIGEVAGAMGATYVPVYERMAAVLIEAGEDRGPGYTGTWWPGLSSLVQHFILGWSYDRISTDRGLLLSPDTVHLNSRGAGILAELVSESLRRE